MSMIDETSPITLKTPITGSMSAIAWLRQQLVSNRSPVK